MVQPTPYLLLQGPVQTFFFFKSLIREQKAGCGG